MIGGYAHLNDTELQLEIDAYRKALREVLLSNVSSVAGEGRRVEFVGEKGKNDIRSELRNLIVEQATRRGETLSGSIAVEIG